VPRLHVNAQRLIDRSLGRAAAGALVLALVISFASAPVRAAAAQTILVEGRSRSYLLYRPVRLEHPGAPALVVVLHGGFGTGAQAQQAYGWDALAEREGFIVVYPNGVGRAWNAGGGCCGRPQREHIDDVAFVGTLLRKMIREEGVDPARLYLTGISNGAALALAYACASAKPAVAAIGSVAGGISAPCEHPAAVSMLEIHGESDRNIPLLGGRGSQGVSGVSWLPAPVAVEGFAASAICETPHTEVRGEVTTRIASCLAGRTVGLISIANAGHQWPGARSPGILGRALGLDPPSDALDATEALWQFFRAQRLPETR